MPQDRMTGKMLSSSSKVVGNSKNEIEGWLQTGNMGFIWFCSGDNIVLNHIGGFDREKTLARVRFDDGPVYSVWMKVREDLDFADIINTTEPNWIALLKKSNTLLIEVSLFSQHLKQIAEFNLAGFSKEVAKCGGNR